MLLVTEMWSQYRTQSRRLTHLSKSSRMKIAYRSARKALKRLSDASNLYEYHNRQASHMASKLSIPGKYAGTYNVGNSGEDYDLDFASLY